MLQFSRKEAQTIRARLPTIRAAKTAHLSKGTTMNPFSLGACVLVVLLAALPAQAQIYKCKNAAGRVEFQQTPCPGAGAMVATPAETVPRDRSAPPESNPYARQLTSLIAGHLAKRDYERAESLAVTTEHHAMISEARRQDAEASRQDAEIKNRELELKVREAEAKAKARASRPQVVIVPQPYQPVPPAPSRSMSCRPSLLGGGRMDCDSY